jgi:hypothetical protein
LGGYTHAYPNFDQIITRDIIEKTTIFWEYPNLTKFLNDSTLILILSVSVLLTLV